MNNHNIDSENLEDRRALRRAKKKRPRMRKHGHALKQGSKRPILHIHKIKKK